MTSKPASDQPLHLVPPLTVKEAAEALGLQPKTLDNDRCDGRLGIPFVRMGRTIRYRPQDLAAWVEQRVVWPTQVGGAS